MIKKNSNITFIGECYDLSNEGKGVVKYNNIVGFVDDLLPFEKAEIMITYLKRYQRRHGEYMIREMR